MAKHFDSQILMDELIQSQCEQIHSSKFALLKWKSFQSLRIHLYYLINTHSDIVGQKQSTVSL